MKLKAFIQQPIWDESQLPPAAERDALANRPDAMLTADGILITPQQLWEGFVGDTTPGTTTAPLNNGQTNVLPDNSVYQLIPVKSSPRR